MSKLLVKLLKFILKKLAQFTIKRYQPIVIAVTGNVGKTSTKLAIASVLKEIKRVRTSGGNLNNDLGLPLTIIGDWGENKLKLVSHDTPPGEKKLQKIIFWLNVLLYGVFNIIFPRRLKYPEVLVLEYGADRPGDIKYLLEIAQPHISVITAIGDIPVHVEFFSGPEELAKEKSRIIECLSVGDFAVLNCDDLSVINLRERTRAKVITFGFSNEADVKIVRFETKAEVNRFSQSKNQKVRPLGISFKLEHLGAFVPVRLDGVFGRAQAYASAAAACVGIIFGLNLVKISENLKNYKPASHRMELLAGINQSYLIDDSYNASPLSMEAALETLKSLPARRKIVVLGDMLEIGKYTIAAHERIGKLASSIADVIITIGPRAKFIADAAMRRAGFRRTNILSFNTAEEAIQPLISLIKRGDLILIKGSHAMQLEKIVEKIKAF